MPIALIRHAHAGSRRDWAADDRRRPLSPRGRRQADRLVALLRPYAPQRVLSSPYTRCVQTVDPLAAWLGVPAETTSDLAEGAGGQALTLIRSGRRESRVLHAWRRDCRRAGDPGRRRPPRPWRPPASSQGIDLAARSRQGAVRQRHLPFTARRVSRSQGTGRPPSGRRRDVSHQQMATNGHLSSLRLHRCPEVEPDRRVSRTAVVSVAGP
jgi:broad specificity phosphatase PhoE